MAKQLSSKVEHCPKCRKLKSKIGPCKSCGYIADSSAQTTKQAVSGTSTINLKLTGYNMTDYNCVVINGVVFIRK